MEAHILARAASRTCTFSVPIRSRISASSTPSRVSLNRTSIRHKSSANRTKRALNIPPEPSFLNTAGSRAAQAQQDHIVFNPPSSAASVYHTPFKFLPKTDPRRRANLTSLFHSSSTISFGDSASSSGALPPKVEHEYYQADKYHLTKEEVREIRRLRTSDPKEWSVLKLAKKYNCSPIFIMMAVKSSAEHKASVKKHLQKKKEQWGPIRTQAREDRSERKRMMLRGEL